jgi:hypothetical protein
MDDGNEMRPQEAEPKASTARFTGATAKKVVRIALGVLLMALGLAALLTPFTPGAWLALVGLELLGLRVLLRDKLCRWAGARPDSRFRKTTCRLLRVDGFDAIKRRWQQRRRGGTGS